MPRRVRKQPTIRDVASHAGVSIATVSRVLNGSHPTPESTRERVLTAVRDLDYVVNANARSLTISSGMVAMVVNDITSEYFMNIAAGVEEQVVGDGKLCLVCSTQREPIREMSVLDLMRQRGAEAVIIVGGMAESPDHLARLAACAESMHRSGSALVLCGRHWIGPPESPVYVVQADVESGAFAATTHLLSAGHTRIGHLAGPPEYSSARLRADGYYRALTRYGIPIDPALVRVGAMTRRNGYDNARVLLEQTDVTAIFAANDLAAAGVLAAARELGRRVPEDLSVVGFDDIQLCEDLIPRLTTVHVPQRELGRVAARLATHRDNGTAPGEQVILGTHIVVRDSVGPPPRQV